MIQLKNRPFAGKVFSDVGGVTSCAVLVRFPTLTILLVEEESELVEVDCCPQASLVIVLLKRKLDCLISAAQKAQTLGIHSCADETLIVCTIQMLRTLSESVLQIETAIDNLLAQIKEMRNNVSLLQSIPGVGSHSAAPLLGEIGDIRCSRSRNSLTRYWVLGPNRAAIRIIQRNKEQALKTWLSLQELHFTWEWLIWICKRGKDSAANPVLLSYYEKKCKTNRQRLLKAASMHKLVFIVFAVLRDQMPFELKTPEQCC